MPTNRTRRSRHSNRLDEHKREQLLHGPDAVPLAGVGYLAAARVASFDKASKADQAAILAQMRADWDQHRGELLQGKSPRFLAWIETN